MTLYDIINSIKQNFSKEWLTATQERIFQNVTQELPYKEFINLYGEVGQGKTFLAWILEKEGYANYFTNESKLEKCAVAIIDNIDFKRITFRNLLANVKFLGINKCIIISRKPIDDDLYHIQLSLEVPDIKKVMTNLRISSYIFQSQRINLWEIIKNATR